MRDAVLYTAEMIILERHLAEKLQKEERKNHYECIGTKNETTKDGSKDEGRSEQMQKDNVGRNQTQRGQGLLEMWSGRTWTK